MPGNAFEIHFDSALTENLRRRLAETRWSDSVTTDWQYGMNVSFLKALVQHWRTEYEFDAAEERLNALPQFRTTIGGFGVHYIHLKGRGPRPKPLLLMNGWPSSFVEYLKLAPRLADPAAFGGLADDAFDVVIPALPGFGFSDRPTRPRSSICRGLVPRLDDRTPGLSDVYRGRHQHRRGRGHAPGIEIPPTAIGALIIRRSWTRL